MHKWYERRVRGKGVCSSVLWLMFAGSPAAAQLFEEKVSNASNVRLTVTNVGTFGNAFHGYRDGTTKL